MARRRAPTRRSTPLVGFRGLVFALLRKNGYQTALLQSLGALPRLATTLARRAAGRHGRQMRRNAAGLASTAELGAGVRLLLSDQQT